VFPALASLLLPVDGSGLVVEADERWAWPGAPGDPEVVVWGRAPRPPSTALPRLAREARVRRRALRRLRAEPPLPFRRVAVHPWPPPEFRAGRVRRRVLAGLRGGAIAELSREPVVRVLDRCAGDAGIPTPVGEFRPVTGGSALVPAPTGLLKVAREGGPGDPYRAGEALERLGSFGWAPALLARGRAPGARWSLEQELPGRRPRRVDRALAAEVLDVCGRLPRGHGPPAAPDEHLAVVAGAFPRWAPELEEVRRILAERLDGLPAVMAHGDLWAGNLLAVGSGLTGVIDWDSWHPSGVPGTDLLHVFGTEEVARSGRDLGRVWLDRPWRSDAFARWTGPYWRALHVRADPPLLETVGASWWAARVGYRLSVRPALAADPGWVGRVIEPVIRALAEGG
jgi:hypothetical protein